MPRKEKDFDKIINMLEAAKIQYAYHHPTLIVGDYDAVWIEFHPTTGKLTSIDVKRGSDK